MAKRAHNEGTLFKRRDGIWVASVSVGSGKRRTYYARTQAEAMAKLAAARRALALGSALPGETRTLSSFAQEYLAEVAKPELKPRAYQSYRMILTRHVTPSLGDIRLERLTAGHVQAYINQKFAGGLSAATVARHRAVLRRAINVAIAWGYVSRNPCVHVSMPREEGAEIQPLSPEQARRFLSATADDRLSPLFRVAFTLGLRQGEILGLTWDRMDLDQGFLRVDRQLQRYSGEYHLDTLKTPQSRRTIGLPAELVDALRAQRIRQLEERLRAGEAWRGNPWDLVFSTPTGAPVSGSWLTHTFQAALQRTGLPRRRFHDCRHAAASFALAQGVDLRTIQEVLGHASYSTTANIYTHLQPEATRTATDRIAELLTGS